MCPKAQLVIPHLLGRHGPSVQGWVQYRLMLDLHCEQQGDATHNGIVRTLTEPQTFAACTQLRLGTTCGSHEPRCRSSRTRWSGSGHCVMAAACSNCSRNA